MRTGENSTSTTRSHDGMFFRDETDRKDRLMTITTGEELVDSAYYAAHGPPHDIWTRLRAESPVHRCEPGSYPPFWAITKYDDITTISTQPERFVNSGGITLLKRADDAALNASALASMRVIITMDPPEHHDVRAIAAPMFTPRGISTLDDAIARSAREGVDRMAGGRRAVLAQRLPRPMRRAALRELVGADVGRGVAFRADIGPKTLTETSGFHAHLVLHDFHRGLIALLVPLASHPYALASSRCLLCLGPAQLQSS
jgi:cytochrome P450